MGSSGLVIDESVIEIVFVEHGLSFSTISVAVFVVSVDEESGDTEAANDSNNDTNDQAGVGGFLSSSVGWVSNTTSVIPNGVDGSNMSVPISSAVCFGDLSSDSVSSGNFLSCEACCQSCLGCLFSSGKSFSMSKSCFMCICCFLLSSCLLSSSHFFFFCFSSLFLIC